MDNIIYHDSPLAAYLQGHDTGERKDISGDEAPEAPSFAPRGPSTLHSKLRGKLPQPLKLPPSGSINRLHSACSRVINSRLGRADNARFLEHFRYIIVASQLLTETSGQGAFKIPAAPGAEGQQQAGDYKVESVNVTGATATGVGAFVTVCLIQWARDQEEGGFSKGRLFVAVFATAVGLTFAYAHATRKWLQHLRHRAINTASVLVANLQTFDTASSSALMLIQEVELVSRGYRLTPLPPITRLDEKGQSRRCARLRRSLKNAFAAALPALLEECATLRSLVEPDDLERYLDVYDITSQDMQEAFLGYSEGEFEDDETLKALRILQYRLISLRRILLCSLLALEAEGDKSDFYRWRTATESMKHIAELSGTWCEKFNKILSEEEQFTMPSPQPKRASTLSPDKERLRTQVRKLGALSSGIRGLQAKMQILREESNKSLEESSELNELGTHLMAQYDSIGADLKSLMQAWEAGKAALALNIDRAERRISQASSNGGLRSPVPSLGGLTAVDEDGTPSDALRALNGEPSLPGHKHSSSSGISASESDEEIFEAIAMPRQRTTMSREERMVKMQEDRVRQATLREQRESNSNMLKELESVISLRP
ncbi:Mysoin-binding motif of peroxisomes-domain-containing protein, partial [Phyllosticta paracitricarpa]